MLASRDRAAEALPMEPVHWTAALALAGLYQDAEWRLGEIAIEASDIYSEEAAARNPLRGLANATHWRTRDAVIRREIWKRPGDRVDEAFAEELERNLRATGLFGSVQVSLRASDGDPGVRDLFVATRDRLSLNGGASASVVGDVASGGVSLGESNFLGMGDSVRFSFFENDQGDSRGVASYSDRYLAGTWTSAIADAGRTDDGDFYGVRLQRPFRFLADRFAWSASARDAAQDRDYFFLGDTVAEVPFQETSGSASATWRDGTRERFVTGGFLARHWTREYGVARTAPGVGVRVPGDTASTFAGVAASWTNIDSFVKATRLDTLEFVQDIQVGTRVSVEAGATYRDELGGDARAQPTLSAAVDRTWAFGASTFASARVAGLARTVAGDATGWSTTGDLRLFQRAGKLHTLAAAATYIEASESEDLPVQLVLGEGNGLRGYPRQEFTGQRFLRVNVEDRIHPGLALGALDFGAVVFADAGWITARGEALGRPLTSVGFGLRIGSTELLGRGVIRVDVSFPLDDFLGRSYDPLVSVSLGQVFGL